MTSIVFNGSYITKKNTGVGVVSKDLLYSLSAHKITTLIPKDLGIKGDIYIPNNLSPGFGLKSHFRRLFWLQNSVPKLMNNAAASNVSIKFNVQGPSFTIASACSSSNHAMGQAFNLIRSGIIKSAITGGSESMLCFGGIKAWEGLRIMSKEACRPFCKNRDGMVQGEGAAIFIFENYQDAKKRGANILAEVAGFSMTSDAIDIVNPSKKGAARAMIGALKDAKFNPEDVEYINAHGTGTLANDKTECAAIKEVFKSHSNKLMISSTKSMHGHLIGGTGAVELLACLLALNKNVIAPTINYIRTDPDCNLDVVPNIARQKKVNCVLSNSFAFGGLNAVLALKKCP